MKEHETLTRISSIHKSCGSTLNRFTRRDAAPGSGVSKTSRCESQTPWPETKSGQAAFRFPRPSRFLEDFMFFSLLPDQFLVGQTLAYDLSAYQTEPVRIRHLFPVVIAKRLFVKISKQVERLDRNIRSLETALQQTPEILTSVRVNLPVHVSFGMVDYLMSKLIEPVVGLERISVNRRASFDVLANHRVQFWLRASLDVLGANLAAALKNCGDYLFAFTTTALNFLCSLARVHVASLTADESLINFYLATKLAAVNSILHSQTNSVEHEPCRLLGDLQMSVDLPRRNAILATGNEPNHRKPLIKTKRRVFENRSGLDAELAFWMPCLALPQPPRRDERDIGTTAGRARNTFRPTPRHPIIQAVIGVLEIWDRVQKALWFVNVGFHTSTIREIS
jgi:hypothetical protein